jgi:hypothetical protein
MTPSFRIPALVLLAGAAMTASAQTPSPTASWSLPVGSKLNFQPDSGRGKIHVAYLENGMVRITVLSSTTVLISPDPTGATTNRSWDLAGGTEITLNLGVADFQVARSGNGLVLTIEPDPGNGNGGTIQSLVVAPTPSATIEPDPGNGNGGN